MSAIVYEYNSTLEIVGEHNRQPGVQQPSKIKTQWIEVEKAVETAADFLKKNKIIAFPSDTIYGLMTVCSLKNARRLHAIRDRDKKNPFLLTVGENYDIARLIDKASVNKNTLGQIENEWPGKRTVILKKNRDLEYPFVDTVGIRKPSRRDYAAFHELLKRVSVPVLAPSLNMPGKTPLQNLDAIVHVFSDKIDAIFFDHGYKPGGPSAIYDFTKNPVKRLR